MARRYVHSDRFPQPGSPDQYLADKVRCAPDGSTTEAGWMRLYLATPDPAQVTCPNCLLPFAPKQRVEVDGERATVVAAGTRRVLVRFGDQSTDSVGVNRVKAVA